MPAGSLDFLNQAFEGFILHIFEHLCLDICLFKFLATLECNQVFLTDIEERIPAVNGFITELILDHIGDWLSVLDLSAESDIVMLVAFQFVVEWVEHVLLDNFGRNCQTTEFISPLSKNVLLSRLKLIYSKWLTIHCLLHLLGRIIATERWLGYTRLVTLSQLFQALYGRLVVCGVLRRQSSYACQISWKGISLGCICFITNRIARLKSVISPFLLIVI